MPAETPESHDILNLNPAQDRTEGLRVNLGERPAGGQCVFRAK